MAASGYVTVEPDPQVAPVAIAEWSPQMVDYGGHAAYANLVAKPSLATRTRALSIFGASMAKLLVQRLIRYELIPFDIRADKSLKGRARFLVWSLRNAVSGPVRKPVLHADGGVAGAMAGRGIHVVTLPADRFSEVESASQPTFDQLVARRGKSNGQRDFAESRTNASRVDQNALYEAVESALRDAGVLDVASAYMGHKARLVDVNPQVNDTSDTFWRDIFPDAELSSLPATAYCHRDASGGDLKAIIYMTDVDARTGPFSYVVGSNRMRIRKVDDLICEANDSNGLAGTDARARELFAALPGRLRQKGSFGNDLTAGSELGDAISKGLWSVKAGKGSIVLFDTKGIHRGGMVEQGERRVITCVIG